MAILYYNVTYHSAYHQSYHCLAKTSVLKQRKRINPHHTLSIQQSTQTLSDSCPAAIRGPKTAKNSHPDRQIARTLINHLLEQIYTAVWIVLADQMLICVHFEG